MCVEVEIPLSEVLAESPIARMSAYMGTIIRISVPTDKDAEAALKWLDNNKVSPDIYSPSAVEVIAERTGRKYEVEPATFDLVEVESAVERFGREHIRVFRREMEPATGEEPESWHE